MIGIKQKRKEETGEDDKQFADLVQKAKLMIRGGSIVKDNDSGTIADLMKHLSNLHEGNSDELQNLLSKAQAQLLRSEIANNKSKGDFT